MGEERVDVVSDEERRQHVTTEKDQRATRDRLTVSATDIAEILGAYVPFLSPLTTTLTTDPYPSTSPPTTPFSNLRVDTSLLTDSQSDPNDP